MRQLSVAVVVTCGFCVCWAQSLSFGVLGGARLTGDLTGGGATSLSKRYVVGPTFELGLPHHFAIEVDALYRREGYQTSFGNFVYNVFADEHANSWEVPLMLKYRLPLPVVKPFVQGGYAVRTMSGSIASDVAGFEPPSTLYSSHSTIPTPWPVSQGIVAGGGVDVSLHRFRLSPGVRYTHWTNRAISDFYADGPSWRSTQNQVDVVLGISFRVR